jgi:hypothetical protein
MAMNQEQTVREVIHHFDLPGNFCRAEPLGAGHINDTWCVTLDRGGALGRCTLQHINSHVFHDVGGMMENVRRVTDHLAGKLAGLPDAARRALTLVPARDGRAWHQDPQGDYWRVYRFIEDARTYDVVQSPEQAHQAARAFGQFQRLLADLPRPRLHDTIPDFHHTPRRFAALEQAIEADGFNRAVVAAPEIQFAIKRKPIVSRLLQAGLPERVTHNDTKFNNVLLDEATGEGVCVIDLDTVMPGLAPYDFGDMVRTTTSPAAEDERDLSRVTLQLPMYEALLRGYLEEAGGFLTSAERSQLPFSGRLITFEIGVRFLTDFLEGDTYFKVHRDGHNLDRCRTQFKLVESMEQQESAMERLLK